MLVNNTIRNDPRVKAEAVALARAGWDVTVVGVLEDGYPKEEIWEGVRFQRLPRTWVMALAIRKLFFHLFNLPAIYSRLSSSNEKSPLESSNGDLTTVASSPTEASKQTPNSTRKPGFFSRVIFDSLLPKAWLKLLSAYHRWRIIPFIMKERFDVYHAHDLDVLEIAAEAACKTQASLVYDSHELWVDWQRALKLSPNLLIDQWSESEKKIAPQADLVITVSDGIAAVLREEYELKALPLVLYNCSAKRPRLRRNILREQHLDKNDLRPIVLYQGAIQHHRGLNQFVEIARQLPAANFFLMGPSNDEQFAASLYRSAESIENLHLLPPAPYDRLAEATASADIGYVCTEPYCRSYDYGLSNKIFEYMAAGLPVVASDVSGHRELMAKMNPDEQPISIIPHNDAAEATRLIGQLLQDRRALERLGEFAYRAASTRFNREFEMQQLAFEYANLLTAPNESSTRREADLA